MKKLLNSDTFWAWLFILPNVLVVIAFIAFPVIGSLGLSLTEWDLISAPRWRGLSNYGEIFKDPIFHKVMFNTVYYTVGTVPPTIALSLFLALLLNRQIRGVLFFRTVYFLPVVSSMVAVALVWRRLYNPDYGLINVILYSLGLPTPGWLSDRTWAMPALIILGIWKQVGYYMVIFLAALQDVPQTYYEAAKIDGASGWKLFTNITLPMISPAMFFVLIMSMINSFQVFDQVYVMTRGGPARATSVIVHYIFQNAFEFFKMGYASALSYILFACIFVITMFQWYGRKRWVFGEAE